MEVDDSPSAESPDRSPGVAFVVAPRLSAEAAPMPRLAPRGGAGVSASADASARDDDAAVGLAADVDIVDAAGVLSCGASGWLREHVAGAARVQGVGGEIRLRIVNDEEMARAHARHLGDPTTTDVMTFDLADGDAVRSRALDVDALLCADEARRRAGERGISIERELLLYAVHAVLHCLGYDDHTDEGAASMHAREDELLEAIGVGATFAAEPRDAHNTGGRRS